MNTKNERVVEELSKVLDQLKSARVAALSEAGDLRAIMHTFLQHEARRIARKLGERHPRSQQLNALLKANLHIVNTLIVERETYQVVVPDVAEDAALVHGRVVDENGRGIAGLRVCLLDQGGQPISEAEPPATDTTGYYAITLDPALIDCLREQLSKGAFLALFTGRGKLIYRDPKPLEITKGTRLVVGVSLNRKDLVEGKLPEPKPEPKESCVPELVGRPEEEAIEMLKSARLMLGQRQAQPAPNQIGRVIAQDPKAGTAVPVGTAVNLVIGVAEVDHQ